MGARPPLGLGVSLPVQDLLRAPDSVRLAQLVEAEGYHSAFLGEVAGTDAFALLGAVAVATERLRIGPGIVSIYNRSPVLTGMAAATLASLAPGRVAVGLGVGSHRIVEDWHGRELRAPLATMREFVAAFRLVVAGERVDVDGREVRVRGFRLQLPSEGPLPVLVGAFNPGMLRLGGAIADGVILAWTPVDELAGKIALVHEGARAAGRDPASVEILANQNAYVGPRRDEALERLRRLVLEYAVRPTHRTAFEGSFPEIDRATELWEAGERRGALALVGDDTVHRLMPLGGADRVADRLARIRAAGVDVPVLVPYHLDPGDPAGPATAIAEVAEATRAAGAAR